MDYFEFAEALDAFQAYRRGESPPHHPVPAVIYTAEISQYHDFIPVFNDSVGEDDIVACWDEEGYFRCSYVGLRHEDRNLVHAEPVVVEGSVQGP